jgi:hypothetical protein
MADGTIDISDPAERESTRIRGFLAKVRPLKGCDVNDAYWDGRSLIESLAVAFEAEDADYHWDAANCASVLDFLAWVQPVKGSCFCNDNSRVNLTCGFHEILTFMADELRRVAPKAKARKRAAEVAHG